MSEKILNDSIYGSRNSKRDQDILRLFLRLYEGFKKTVKFIVAWVVPLLLMLRSGAKGLM